MNLFTRAFFPAVLATTIASCSFDGSTPEIKDTFPPRPANVVAEQVPPCSMLTLDQARLLGLRKPSPSTGTVDGRPSPTCTWIGTAIGYNIQYIPIGADAAVGAPGSAVAMVNGFGAVQTIVNMSGAPPTCQVTIDVASGQSIRVQANAVPDAPYDTDELCRRATEAASLVMTTVVATASR